MRKPKFPNALPADALDWTKHPDSPDLDFTPVPRLRRRREGWSLAARDYTSRLPRW